MRTAISVLILGVLLATAAPAPALAATTAEVRYGTAIVEVTNNVRAAHDLRKLSRQGCLQRFARRQAVAMAARGEIFHQRLGRVLRRCGLSAVGENVAMGYPSGRAVVRRGWMRSAGHRANILTARYRLIGAAAVHRDGTWWAVQLFGRG